MAAAPWPTIAGPAYHNAGPFITSRGVVQCEGGQAVGAERNSRLADGPIFDDGRGRNVRKNEMTRAGFLFEMRHHFLGE
jgi:hypothetical protein